ncbi:unnamed protein product [Trichobilharzia regenti]|nr:unnamed protein product [Trichobilharzia regenti]
MPEQNIKKYMNVNPKASENLSIYSRLQLNEMDTDYFTTNFRFQKIYYSPTILELLLFTEEEDYLETDGGNELLQEERNTVQERTHNSYSQLNDAELSPDHVVRQSMSPKRLKEVLRMNAGLSLSISYASSVGGIATTVGTPPNTYLYGLIVSRYGDSTDLDFGTWMLFALPLSIIMFLIVWFWFSVLFFGPR